MRRSGRIRAGTTAYGRPSERISHLRADESPSTGEGTGWQEMIGAAGTNSRYA
jgi:hypothetical protein